MGAFDNIRNLFGKKKPKKPTRASRDTLAGGHRGHALGSLASPDLSQENIEKWQQLTEDEVESFVYDNELVFVHSTNVAAAQYFFEDKKLMLEFNDGSAYLYSNISEEDAIYFMKAQSKGRFVWDILGHPNSPTGVKKSYVKIR